MNFPNIPTKPDGTPDYVEATRLARLNPPASSPQELAAELRLLNIKERMRIDALVLEGGLAALQREKDAESNSYRRRQETEGHARTEAETKRLADLLAARALEQASGGSPIHDRNAEAKQKYDEAMRLLAEKVAAPPTTKDMQDAANIAQMRIEQRQRFDAAKAESLRPKVAGEKF
jgi:hypothetical protein